MGSVWSSHEPGYCGIVFSPNSSNFYTERLLCLLCLYRHWFDLLWYDLLFPRRFLWYSLTEKTCRRVFKKTDEASTWLHSLSERGNLQGNGTKENWEEELGQRGIEVEFTSLYSWWSLLLDSSVREMLKTFLDVTTQLEANELDLLL